MVARIIELGDNHAQEIVSDRVSFIRQSFKRPGKGGRTSKIKALYIGADNWVEAQAIAQVYRGRTSIREAQRVTDWDYEVKFQGDFTEAEIFKIADELEDRVKLVAKVITPNFFSRAIPSKSRTGTLNRYKAPIRSLDFNRRNALIA